MTLQRTGYVGIGTTTPQEALSVNGKKEMKQVGAMRRRPLTAVEELNIFLHRLEERLVVLPHLADSIRNRLQATEVEWRVDTEFVSEARIPEVSVTKLLPQGYEEVSARIAQIMKLAEIPPAVRVE